LGFAAAAWRASCRDRYLGACYRAAQNGHEILGSAALPEVLDHHFAAVAG
jgi:hypothetical protein